MAYVYDGSQTESFLGRMAHQWPIDSEWSTVVLQTMLTALKLIVELVELIFGKQHLIDGIHVESTRRFVDRTISTRRPLEAIEFKRVW